MQLFVGAWAPQDALTDYPRAAFADLRWSTPSQWLVTLRPLGHVDDATAALVADALAAELDGAPGATATVTAVERDGWLMARVGGLDELRDVVFEATLPVVPATHRTTWQPSVVLARGRTPKEAIAALDASWPVGEVVLARATRTAEGPGYETVASFPLGA